MAERVPGRTPLEMPYAIDGDKVGGQSIKYMFAKVRNSCSSPRCMAKPACRLLSQVRQRQALCTRRRPRQQACPIEQPAGTCILTALLRLLPCACPRGHKDELSLLSL